MLKILKPISFFVINIKNTTLKFNKNYNKQSKNKKINKKMHRERRILRKNVEKYNQNDFYKILTREKEKNENIKKYI